MPTILGHLMDTALQVQLDITQVMEGKYPKLMMPTILEHLVDTALQVQLDITQVMEGKYPKLMMPTILELLAGTVLQEGEILAKNQIYATLAPT